MSGIDYLMDNRTEGTSWVLEARGDPHLWWERSGTRNSNAEIRSKLEESDPEIQNRAVTLRPRFCRFVSHFGFVSDFEFGASNSSSHRGLTVHSRPSRVP